MLATFRDTVRHLVNSNHVSHADLVKEMRAVLVEEAKKLPPRRLLLCKSYGGYELSEEFTTWKKNDNCNRIENAVLMREFGAACVQKYPTIAHLVQRYKPVLDDPHFHEYKCNISVAHVKFTVNCRSFGEAIQKMGGKSGWSIWTQQRFYDAIAMKYLIENPLLNLHLDADANIARFEEAMGLLFASTIYCKLAIEEIPALVGYEIVEYDGLETVRIL